MGQNLDCIAREPLRDRHSKQILEQLIATKSFIRFKVRLQYYNSY